MSWLSSTFSSPKRAVHQVLDPLGSAIQATHDSGKGSAATKAADAATAAANAANAPGPSFGGNSADSAYGSFAKPFDVQEFYKQQDPGYMFRLQQGTQGLVNGAAAGSGSLSGAATKDLLDYNQGAASQEYGNAFNRYQTSQGNIFQRLYQLAGLGQASASNVGANNTALAGTAGQAIQNAGTAQGGGIAGVGNALAGGAVNYAGYRYAQTHPGQQPAQQPVSNSSASQYWGADRGQFVDPRPTNPNVGFA